MRGGLSNVNAGGRSASGASWRHDRALQEGQMPFRRRHREKLTDAIRRPRRAGVSPTIEGCVIFVTAEKYLVSSVAGLLNHSCICKRASGNNNKQMGAIMGRDAKPDNAVMRQHTAALQKHAAELKRHSKAIEAAAETRESLVSALHTHAAALSSIATDQPGQKEQAIMDCITDWLHDRNRLDKNKEVDPEANMGKDYHFSGPPEMKSFLVDIAGCLKPKRYAYNYSKDATRAMLTKLVGSTVTAVAFEIGRNTAYVP
jgi:hypothetical protein